MKAPVEQRLFSLGCALVFTGVCAFGYLALSRHWGYSMAAAALLGVWWLICELRWKVLHRRQLAALDAAFAPLGSPLPHLKQSSSYGFPTFTLTFTSEAELKRAQDSGSIAAFKRAIQSLHAHGWSKQNPFDADKAVWCTYEGRKFDSERG